MISIPIRAWIAFFGFSGTLTSYILRINLNIALVMMTDNNEVLCKDSTHTDSVTDESGNTIFCWNETDKGNLLSAFFYGYIVLQILGGTFAEKFGSKRVLGWTQLFCAILTLIAPVASKANYWFLFTLRVLQGLAAGVTYPSLPPLIMRWAPMEEHSKFITITYIGSTMGTILSYPIYGIILDRLGWEAVFYIGGCCGVIWCVFWFFFVSDDPEHHRFIGTDEKEHILRQRKQPMNEIGKKRPPYLKILLTPNVWVLMLTDFCISFGLYMILTEGPNFISNILDKDIFENGLLNALPHLAILTYGIISSFLSDFFLRKNYITRPTLRYIGCGLCTGMQGITAAALGYTTESWILCMTIMTIGTGFKAFSYLGHLSAVYDIAPTYSGTVCGFVNMAGNLTGFITPLVTAAFTQHDAKDVAGWRNLFLTASGLYFLAFVVFPLCIRLKPAKFELDGAEKSLNDRIENTRKIYDI